MVTRDQQYYCGRCALAHDWEEIISIAQEASEAPLQGTAPPPAPPERASAPV